MSLYQQIHVIATQAAPGSPGGKSRNVEEPVGTSSIFAQSDHGGSQCQWDFLGTLRDPNLELLYHIRMSIIYLKHLKATFEVHFCLLCCLIGLTNPVAVSIGT